MASGALLGHENFSSSYEELIMNIVSVSPSFLIIFGLVFIVTTIITYLYSLIAMEPDSSIGNQRSVRADTRDLTPACGEVPGEEIGESRRTIGYKVIRSLCSKRFAMPTVEEIFQSIMAVAISQQPGRSPLSTGRRRRIPRGRQCLPGQYDWSVGHDMGSLPVERGSV